MEEWVEVKGSTVEVAVDVALSELNVSDQSQVDIEIIQQPERGFFGIGSKDAIVKVKRKAPTKPKKKIQKKGQQRGQRRPGTAKRPSSQQSSRGHSSRDDRQSSAERDRQSSGDISSRPERRSRPPRRQEPVDYDGLSKVVSEFLEGLLEAFGLEGEVKVWVDDEIIFADVIGDQTAALVGPSGMVLEAIHELTKTVMQRKMQQSSRLRLDIAGYATRRREALTIYTNQLVDQVIADGGELTLEPMSAGDRKVVHNTVAERDEVRSYSEGRAPDRYVVISTVGQNAESTQPADKEVYEDEADQADTEADLANAADTPATD